MYISSATCPHSLLLPFPEHGRGREGETERGSQSTRLMPVDRTSSKREARQARPHMEESAQNAWGPGKMEVEEMEANSQACFPPPPSRAAGPWPNHTSHLCIYSSCSGWSPLCSSSPLVAVPSAHLFVSPIMCPAVDLVVIRLWGQD